MPGTNRYTYSIIDTAGRLHIDLELMDELVRIRDAVKPQEILLVVDAMTGQDAVNVAQTFNDKLDIQGRDPYQVGRRHPRRRRPERARGGRASPSSSPAWARSSAILSPSTRTAWPAVSWAWATC